ncbi:GNAT family N-acetyltransferase [Halobacillus litoralis]|uniref:GNAT family N-acetyltransferase n=1 Tax=Halobacillus litoralis TaxID=45668 RepID=UPI001CD54C1F|nr:GNAT family N-acetyltransferase [Halobacillus litoralis]MCA0969299.1 GNAT family N-acetyltransferase [Halobacillus litoralis]
MKNGSDCLAILEYGMSSSNSGQPWLSLLMLNNSHRGIGMGRKVYLFYEDMMVQRGVETIEIAVHAENERAFRFWTTLGYQVFNERLYEGKWMYSMRKCVGSSGEEET